jgi:hypothetical protein
MTQHLLLGVPETFLIDRDGVLVWRRKGPLDPQDPTLPAAIENALAE